MLKQFGFLGLGNMGLNIATNLFEKGHDIHVWNRSETPRVEARKIGMKTYDSLEELIHSLDTIDDCKVIFLMVSAGVAVDSMLFGEDGSDISLEKLLSGGDIIVEASNSHYKDTLRRGERLKKKGIKYIDMGVSGGVEGARMGACAMIGGDKSAFDYIEPVIKDMCLEGGYGYFGKEGSGHYVKMIHNAIEYGMMQSIAEGLNLLNESEFNPNIPKLLSVWNRGSIIESKLIKFLEKSMLKGDVNLMEKEVGALGTGMWAVIDALERGVPLDSIARAVFNRYASRGTSEYAFKIIQAMRAEFGAHTGSDRESNVIKKN